MENKKYYTSLFFVFLKQCYHTVHHNIHYVVIAWVVTCRFVHLLQHKKIEPSACKGSGICKTTQFGGAILWCRLWYVWGHHTDSYLTFLWTTPFYWWKQNHKPVFLCWLSLVSVVPTGASACCATPWLLVVFWYLLIHSNLGTSEGDLHTSAERHIEGAREEFWLDAVRLKILLKCTRPLSCILQC